MLPLYLLVCAYSFGLINLAPLLSLPTPFGDFNGNDILLLALLVVSIPGYLQQRRILNSRSFRFLELAWLVFIMLLAVAAFRSPADSLRERLVNVRFVQDYLLFFPSIAVMTSKERVRKIAFVGVIFAVIGTGLTIAQSLHGLDNLFESPFYNIGAWGGNKIMVGGIARVNLPISNWIAFVLLAMLSLSLLRGQLWTLILSGFLSIAILVNFARSLWLGMAGGFAVEVVLLFSLGALLGPRLFRLLLVPLVLGLGFLAAPFVGLDGLTEAVQERLTEGLYFFSTSTGTWGGRLDVGAAAMDLWAREPWLGVGTAYYSVFGQWIDLGLPALLVSVGIVGLILELVLFATCFFVGIQTLKRGVRYGIDALTIAGVVVPAELILIIVYQAWIDPRAFSILAFASALAIAAPAIFPAGEESPELGKESPQSPLLRNKPVYANH